MKVSVKTIARTAGLLYLVNIILGFFAIGYVPGIVITSDTLTTAQNILAHEQLYRLSLVAHLIILLTNFPLAVIFWKLFKPVNKVAAQLVVFFTLVGTAVEICNLLNQFLPLVINSKQFTGEFTTGQAASLAFVFHRLNSIGVNMAFFFFGFYGICMGYLVIKSTFLPRTIGALMIVGGTCYIFNSLATFLSPKFATQLFPYILMPSGLAELILCLWLLIVGLNANKWQEKYAAYRKRVILQS
jgi:hypothetical protein